MSWIKDFREFANDTSAHGVKYIFESPFRILKLMFLIAWVACVCFSSYVIFKSFTSFINMPTGTKFEVIIEKNPEEKNPTVKFPTISVCSVNKVKKSFIEDEANEDVLAIYNIIDEYNVDQLKELREKPELLEKVKDYPYQDIIHYGGPDPNRLLFCSQTNKMCDELVPFLKNTELKPFVQETTSTGRCWRVNPDGLIHGKGGDFGRMKLMFWADIQDYSARSANNANQGYVVAFHDHTTYGETMNSGFLMSAGTYYKVDLSLKKESRTPPPSGTCNDTIITTSYGNFSEGSCVLECKNKWVHEECGCVQVLPPNNTDTNYKACTLKQWVECGLERYLQWFNNFTDTELTHDFCPCDTACNEVRYEAQVSSSSVSSAFAKHIFPAVETLIGEGGFSNAKYGISYDSPEDILDNLMVLEVMFTSMQTSEIKEVLTYTSANLLGDIGGVLGLFLGASLFTILEFFQFVLMSILKYCCNVGVKEAGYSGDLGKEDL